ncbi:MAG TPA: hypothetical protein DFR83_15820, partial [Deltaproteobacteria bacterium]|nr:hypothetical protein [Deltaproteobacteria bacterium]
MNSMMRSSAIYGGLLAALMAASWLDYVAAPELELDGKVILVSGEVEDLTKITWTSKNNDEAIIERKEDALGTFYDVQYTRWTEVKTPEPPTPPEPDAPKDGAEADGETNDASADATAPEPEPTEAPEPEYDATVSHFKSGDKGTELFESLAPLLALRKLDD